jgi:hypothetical protein
MALDDVYNVTHPGQRGATGAVNAQHIEEYTGVVEATIERLSVLAPHIPMRSVRGTSIFSNFGVGESALQKVVPGAAPDGTVNKFGKNSVTVDTLVLARSAFPLLETFQVSYDARAEVGREHGKKLAKFTDQALFIAALKAAAATQSAYAGLTSGAGHSGASQVVMSNASDYLDPAKLLSYLDDLFISMEAKDVDPVAENLMIVSKPEHWYRLSQNELLINTQYVTANGTKLDNVPVLKDRGVPVLKSNNFPGGETITGHLLSNSDNSNFYDGDFTKTVFGVFGPRAIQAGETIPLTTSVYWSQEYLQWLVDAYTSFGAGPNRVEYAGRIDKP